MNEYDYLAKAKNNMEKEKYHEVISLCNKALKINKELAEAYSFRGNANYELGKYKDAAEDFTHAIEQEPNEAEHYYDRSWAYYYMDEHENAFVDINKALELKPDCSGYYYDKGRFEYWSDRNLEAITDLTKGIELKPTENKYLFRGNCHFELEEYDLAIKDYSSAIEINPEFYKAYYNRGYLYRRIDQFDNAEKDLKKAIKLYPQHDEAMIELGFVYIEMGKKNALKYFNSAIKTNPCAKNYYWKVRARQKMLARKTSLEHISKEKFAESYDENKIYNKKQAQEDLKDLNKAIVLDSKYENLYEMRVKRLLFLREYKKAIQDYTFLIESSPKEHLNYTMRAFCHERIGEYTKALKDCEQSVELNDGCADVIIFGTRGLANYKLGKIEKALTDFNQTLEIEDDTETYYYRGLANYKLRFFKRALSDFKKALKQKPDIESKYSEKIPFLIKIMIFFSSEYDKNEAPIGLNNII